MNHNERARDKAAWKAVYAARHLDAIAARYGGAVAALEAVVHDARLTVLNNDLRCLSMCATWRDEPRAAWFASVTEHKYELCEPFDLPTHVLRRCDYRIVVHGTGRHRRYADLLHTAPPEPDAGPVPRDRTGVVMSLPRRGRRGEIESHGLVFQLLPRDRRDLSPGARVEFCSSRSIEDGRPVAFLTRRTGEPS
ncbi:hypothetical protein ACIBF1_01605 [Spirillospora sp. NPDC050679]